MLILTSPIQRITNFSQFFDKTHPEYLIYVRTPAEAAISNQHHLHAMGYNLHLHFVLLPIHCSF